MEEKKRADCEPLNNVRDLIKFLNNNNIKKEDIVTVLDKGQLFLIYYN